MTFKVTVTYQAFNDKIMQKEFDGVHKIERVWEKFEDGKEHELLKIRWGSYNGATWGIGAILNINMIPEIDNQ